MRLEGRGIIAGYGGKIVLDNMAFDIPEGRVVTLFGANGSGKSTLLKVIGRMLRPRAGAALLDGREVGRWDSGELARRMAVLPQFHHAPGDMRVRELAAMGRFPHRGGEGREQAALAVERALRLTRMGALAERPLGALSGGERQRAWLAMTLAQEPELLLLDEPTAYLDLRGQFEMAELVRKLNLELGISILMVLHDLNLAARCSDWMLAVKGGRICRAGTPEEMMTPEILREIYGVKAEIGRGKDGFLYSVPVGVAEEADE